MFQATDYQRRAIEEMVHGNKMLRWDPGVGKTYPCLVAMQFVSGPALVICPAHLREQWAAQAAIHAPLLSVEILDTLNVKASLGADITICSYEYAAHLPRWKELRGQRWGAIIIDEAHYLMNLDANRTRALLGAKPLTEKHGLVFAADCVWPLTGTPFTFPHQIYPILAALFPEALQRPSRNGPGLMTMKEWTNEFCELKFTSFGEKVVGAINIPELRTRLAPFLDKMKLEDAVKDLPSLIVDEIPMRGKLRELLDGLNPDVLEQYESLVRILTDDDIHDDDKLAELEACSGSVMAQVRHAVAVVKIEQTAEIIKNELASGVEKVLVYGWHKAPLAELARKLKARVIHGDVTKANRQEAIEDFCFGRDRVLCGQISSIGTGVDGLQEVCHRGIFMESSWAYRDNKQAVHRLYRKGQRLPVHMSFVTLLGSIDEYVVRVLKRNAEFVKMALD